MRIKHANQRVFKLWVQSPGENCSRLAGEFKNSGLAYNFAQGLISTRGKKEIAGMTIETVRYEDLTTLHGISENKEHFFRTT